MEFSDLHLTENISEAVKSLKGASGIYCISHSDSGCMYIGSSIDLGSRLTDHFINGVQMSTCSMLLLNTACLALFLKLWNSVPKSYYYRESSIILIGFFYYPQPLDTISYRQLALPLDTNTRRRLRLR